MESGAISDAQISASSQWDTNHAAKQARLHFQAHSRITGSWSSRTNNVNQWLQIDLGYQYTYVTRVATQGRNGHIQWVTMYKLQYSDDGVNFQYYTEHGVIKVRLYYQFIPIAIAIFKVKYGITLKKLSLKVHVKLIPTIFSANNVVPECQLQECKQNRSSRNF